MKGIFLLSALSAVLIISCTVEDPYPYTYSNEMTIYSSEEEIEFREIVLMINPYLIVDSQKKYVVAERISDVRISVNEKNWGDYESLSNDISAVPVQVENGYNVSDTKFSYGVVAPFSTTDDTLSTAGEYADLLTSSVVLDPGFYICRVSSFSIVNATGIPTEVPVNITAPIEVEENKRSLFLGEFDVRIY